jgi:hypothetical protein
MPEPRAQGNYMVCFANTSGGRGPQCRSVLDEYQNHSDYWAVLFGIFCPKKKTKKELASEIVL